MHIIKLDAIDSTNSFLKELLSNSSLENFTVVTAEAQSNGRGQAGSTWESEPGKNLMFSVFIEFSKWRLEDLVYLNFAVSLAIFKVLYRLGLPKLSIKWPNDILSDTDKICGILIENSVNSKFLKSSIVGIGLNVNQEVFSNDLGLVSSIKNKIGHTLDKSQLLEAIITQLKVEIDYCIQKNFVKIKDNYLSVLYMYLKPTMFKDQNERVFMGRIMDINADGKLTLELEDDGIQHFGLKEVKLLR